MSIEDDPTLQRILETERRVAVLGIKNGATDDAYRVPAYMHAQGYEILGINPKLQEVLGEPCVARIADLPPSVDLLNVFRASEHIAGHVEEVLAMPERPRTVWLQLGIRDDASAARLEAEGIRVVQDRCILVEHRRLLGGGRA
jgi:predicted CoA-binding protein